MKKIILPVVLFAVAAIVFACGTTSGSLNLQKPASGTTDANTSATPPAKSTGTSDSSLKSWLGNLLGKSSAVSQNDLVGTWNYQGADCVFESESLLKKAGGELAAKKVESQLNTLLAKVGFKSGKCSYTFKSDNTYTAVIAGHTINGNYTLDTKNNTVKMTYLAGLGTVTPKVVKSGSKVSLLYESDKLLKLVSTVSALSNSTAAKALSSFAGAYDGLYIGMELSKK